MKVNDELEIDIENKYVNKVVFTLEESIYILKRKDFCDEVEDMALDRLIKYIKEESIQKSKVREKIKELDKKAKQQLKGVKGQDRYFIKQIYHSKRSFGEELLEEE